MSEPSEDSATIYQGPRGEEYWARNELRLALEGPYRARAIRSLLSPAEIIPYGWLEIGMGRGHNLMTGDYGCDCDRRQMAQCHKQVTTRYGLATAIPFPDNFAPVVFSVGVLMHLPDGDWQKALSEMVRVTKRYVILGEYWGETEALIDNPYWPGLLWRRPYQHPLLRLLSTTCPLSPFDTTVSFMLYQVLEAPAP